MAAKKGSVAAMKTLLDEAKRDGDGKTLKPVSKSLKPVSVIDELARRRGL